MKDQVARNRQRLDIFINKVWKAYLVLVGVIVLSYAVSENNLFVNEEIVLEQIAYENVLVRTIMHTENNLFRYSVATVATENGDEKYYIDAEYKYVDGTFVREYRTWPVEKP